MTRAQAWILVPGAWRLSPSSIFARAGEAAREGQVGRIEPKHLWEAARRDELSQVSQSLRPPSDEERTSAAAGPSADADGNPEADA